METWGILIAIVSGITAIMTLYNLISKKGASSQIVVTKLEIMQSQLNRILDTLPADLEAQKIKSITLENEVKAIWRKLDNDTLTIEKARKLIDEICSQHIKNWNA